MDHTSAVAAVDRGALADAWQQLVEAAAGASTQRARISVIRALEDLKDAACAAQAELAVTVVAAEVASADAPSDQAERAERDGNSREVTSERGAASPASRARARRRATARRSAIAQIALARRESPHRAGVLVGAAEALVAEMPCTLAALRSGALNEYRTILLVRETACLDLESRTMVDRELCGDPKGLVGLGTKRLVAEAKTAAYRLDPASIVRRAERDAAERCVTLRPAPGAMTYLTALVPLAQGVAMLAQLRLAAQSARARGDERSQGQVMADTLVERVTGQAKADAVPVAVNLIMSDATLLASGQEAARLDGGHPMPAQLARELVANALDAMHNREHDSEHDSSHDREHGGNRELGRQAAWLRRLYADPGGNLVALDSRSRTFPAGLAAMLRVRDQGLCRTPWCDAPIAHLDHITPAARGGSTTPENGQGLCAGCNYAKQADGWTQQVGPEASRHSVITITPTGHKAVSTAAAVPAALARATGADASAATRDAEPAAARFTGRVIDLAPRRPDESPLEIALRHAS